MVPGPRASWVELGLQDTLGLGVKADCVLPRTGLHEGREVTGRDRFLQYF